MFHNSTTLHHCRIQFSAIGRESRVIHLNWLGTKHLELSAFWASMSPLRKLGRAYSYLFGWPLIKEGGKYAMKGLKKGMEGVEWTAIATREMVKGALITGGAVPVAAAYSRLVALKRTTWDTGKAALVAPFKTAWAMLTSPGEVVNGVRDAVSGVWNNGKEALSSLFSLELGKTVTNTRQAIGSLFKPITRPVRKILAPAALVVATAVGAQTQTVTKVYDAMAHTMPMGVGIMKNAGNTASAELAANKAVREAKIAVAKQEKEAEEAAWKAKVDEHRGKGGAAAAGKGGAPKKLG